MRVGRVDVGQRSETVHRANLSAIVRELHEHGPLSRSELVAATGLTRSAIRAPGRRARRRRPRHRRTPPSRSGRPAGPSPLVRLNPDGAVVLALEILVDSIAAAIVGLGGETLERDPRRPAARSSSRSTTWSADLAALAGDLRRRRDDRPDRRDRRRGRGRRPAQRRPGVDGPEPRLDRRPARRSASRARSATSSRSPSQRRRPRRRSPRRRRGAAVGVDDVLYVSGEVGVGGGMIVDGRR